MQRSIFVLCLRRVPFFRQALLHRERVSEGLCSQQRFLFLPPAGYFLSIAKESTQRTPAETHGFCTSFVICKSCYLKFAEAGNWSASTHAAAALGG